MKKILVILSLIVLSSCAMGGGSGLPSEQSLDPSVAPSVTPSVAPSVAPSVEPSVESSFEPSVSPSVVPSIAPSVEPSVVPSVTPSMTPSVSPSVAPSEETSVIDISVDPHGEGDDTNLSIQDSPILHCWDWSVSMVSNKLEEISNAGYKAVQLSPLHPSKSTGASDCWWNLYQPLGYKVATNNENPLGNKTSLTALCKKADEYGIKVVMDVVTNHLAGDNDHTLDSRVRNFERNIYDNQLYHKNGQVQDWGNREQVVTRAIGGYVDVLTSHTTVQASIIRMLKEYIDCGVKGFRFDAAKHIEVPEDNASYRSNYWPNVINAINSYGLEKYNEKPYVYGEILDGTAGVGWDAYTDRMSVTDNRQGEAIRNAVKNRDGGGAANGNYNTGKANKTVLWAESHDTFENSNQQTTNMNTDVLNLTYAIQISRKDATALYFARPAENYPVDRAPQVISGPKSDFKSNLISGSNKFHNQMLGNNEYLSSYSSVAINERVGNETQGALIADTSFNSSVTVNLPHLPDGTYKDLISNKTYQVTNHKATVSLTKGGCALVKGEKHASKGPKIEISSDVTTFQNEANVSISLSDADVAYYQINGGSKVLIENGNTTFKVGEGLEDGNVVIEVKAQNSEGTIGKTLTLSKFTPIVADVVLYNVPTDVTLFAWIWLPGMNGKWVELNQQGNTYFLDIKGKETQILFATFPSGTKLSDASWDNKIKQTEDMKIKDSPFTFEELPFKN